jgi:hypothetical protein
MRGRSPPGTPSILAMNAASCCWDRRKGGVAIAIASRTVAIKGTQGVVRGWFRVGLAFVACLEWFSSVVAGIRRLHPLCLPCSIPDGPSPTADAQHNKAR